MSQDRAIALSDLNDDPSLIEQLDEKDVTRLLKDYHDGEPLAGTLPQQLSLKAADFAKESEASSDGA